MEWEQPQQEQDLERIFWIRLIGILGLLFFVIPIRIEPDTTDSDLKLFEKYVADYNKSYRDLPTEYSARFVKFQVGDASVDLKNDSNFPAEFEFLCTEIIAQYRGDE